MFGASNTHPSTIPLMHISNFFRYSCESNREKPWAEQVEIFKASMSYIKIHYSISIKHSWSPYNDKNLKRCKTYRKVKAWLLVHMSHIKQSWQEKSQALDGLTVPLDFVELLVLIPKKVKHDPKVSLKVTLKPTQHCMWGIGKPMQTYQTGLLDEEVP